MGEGRRGAADGLRDVSSAVAEEELRGRQEEEEQESSGARGHRRGRRGQAAGTAQRWQRERGEGQMM